MASIKKRKLAHRYSHRNRLPRLRVLLLNSHSGGDAAAHPLFVRVWEEEGGIGGNLGWFSGWIVEDEGCASGGHRGRLLAVRLLGECVVAVADKCAKTCREEGRGSQLGCVVVRRVHGSANEGPAALPFRTWLEARSVLLMYITDLNNETKVYLKKSPLLSSSFYE